MSKPVNVTKGVLQEEVSSFLFITLFLSEFEEFLKSEGVKGVSIDHLTEIILLAYADDIVLFVELKKILKALQKYCIINQLVVKNQKKVIIYRKSDHAHNKKFKFMYGKEKIDIVKNYTYLCNK